MKIVRDSFKDIWGNKRHYYRCIDGGISWVEIYPVLYGSLANSGFWFQSGEVWFKKTKDTGEMIHQRKARWVVKYVLDREWCFEFFRYLENAKEFAGKLIMEKLYGVKK